MPNMTAVVLPLDGEPKHLPLSHIPENRLRSMQEIVGGYIQAVPLPGRMHLIFNEDAKEAPHAVNQLATALAHASQAISLRDYIAGIAAIVPTESLE